MDHYCLSAYNNTNSTVGWTDFFGWFVQRLLTHTGLKICRIVNRLKLERAKNGCVQIFLEFNSYTIWCIPVLLHLSKLISQWQFVCLFTGFFKKVAIAADTFCIWQQMKKCVWIYWLRHMMQEIKPSYTKANTMFFCVYAGSILHACFACSLWKSEFNPPLNQSCASFDSWMLYAHTHAIWEGQTLYLHVTQYMQHTSI